MDETEIIESLTRSRSNILTIIEQMTVSPKPNYVIDGQKVDNGTYLKQLMDMLKALDAQLNMYDEGEITSIVVP